MCVLPLKTKPLKGGTRCPHRVLSRTLSNQLLGDPAFAQAFLLRQAYGGHDGGHRNGLHRSLNRYVLVLLFSVAYLVLFSSTSVRAAPIALAWNDNSTDEIGFKIERAVANGNFTQIATVGADIAAYVDTTAVTGTAYTYRVRAYNAWGDSAYSNIVGNAPAITTQPFGPTLVSPGGSASLTVTVNGSPVPTIQWQLSANGGSIWTNVPNLVPYSGGTTATLTITGASPELNRAQFRAVATNNAGAIVSNPALLLVAPTSRLANLSVRAVAGSGSNTLIVGFVIGGGLTKSLLVRGIGPTLSAFGVPGPLDDPVLSVYSGSRFFDSNDDWGTAINAAQIAPISASVGAFA